jgi:hypothetical protein
MRWSGNWKNRALEVAYCFAAGVAFSFALQWLHGDPVHDALIATLFSPLGIIVGWGCSGLLFWPALGALAVIHFNRPSLAALLAISLLTAGAYLRAIEGFQVIMSA